MASSHSVRLSSSTQPPWAAADNIGIFGFPKLDVYQCATRLLSVSAPLAERAPRGYASLADQLRRAALSIPLNIAEGSGKFNKDARRFYAIARGSALECAAILDAFESLAVATADDLTKPRELLDRIVAMLTVLPRG